MSSVRAMVVSLSGGFRPRGVFMDERIPIFTGFVKDKDLI
jgi:hypothetical protein